MTNPFQIIDQRLSNIEQLLLDIKHGCYQQTSPVQKQKFNIHQLSEYLNTPANSIYGMVSRGEIPCSKPGKRLIFDKTQIDDWLKNNRKKTASEISEEAESFLSSK